MTSNTDCVREGPSKQHPRLNGENKQRDRRMLANLQSALGAPNGVKQRRLRSPKKNAFAFTSMSEALERLNLADVDTTVSLSDVRPYVLANEKKFNQEELQILSKDLCRSAMLQTNAHHVVGLCIELVYNRVFMEEMGLQLRDELTTFMNAAACDDSKSNQKALPEFFAQLSMAKWPRGRDKPFDVSNPVLYVIINTIVGWLNYIIEISTKDEEFEVDDILTLRTCCEAVYTFTMVGQRSLWLNFPDVFDKVYEAVSAMLSSNLRLPRSLKSSYLQLFMLLNKWSASNAKKCTTTGTQTIGK